MGSKRRIGHAVYAGLAMGCVYGLMGLSIADGNAGPQVVGAGPFIAEGGLSLTHYNLLIASLMNLLVLFVLVIQAGGIIAEELRRMAPYRLTRKRGRMGLYCEQAIYMTAISCAYLLAYTLAFVLVQVVATGCSLSLDDWRVICTALCAHLIPGTLAVILWANFLAYKLGRASACACVIGACSALLLVLPVNEEYSWVMALNPMMNISPSWKGWFSLGGGMDYGAYSAIYWLIFLCATLIFQAFFFRRTDIL